MPLWARAWPEGDELTIERNEHRAARLVGRAEERSCREAAVRSGSGVGSKWGGLGYPAPELLWGLGGEAYKARNRRRGGFYQLFERALRARKFTLTESFAEMVEEMRTDHLGVTVLAPEKACLPAGSSWWEWDPRIPGRLPPAPGQLALERMGALLELEECGQRGTMHFAVAGRSPEGRPVVDTMALSCTFDWREAYERPPSLVDAVSVSDARKILADSRGDDATMAELEMTPVFAAALARRFGVIESPYFAAELRERLDGPYDWKAEPDLLRAAVDDVNQEALFIHCVALVVRLARPRLVFVPRGMKLPMQGPWGDRSPCAFWIVQLGNAAPVGSPGREG